MPAHRAVLESENSSKADNARKNTAFPPVCKNSALTLGQMKNDDF